MSIRNHAPLIPRNGHLKMVESSPETGEGHKHEGHAEEDAKGEVVLGSL